MLGFCDGYTTFSSISLQTLNLVGRGEWPQTAGNVALSATLCMIAVTVGHHAAAALKRH